MSVDLSLLNSDFNKKLTQLNTECDKLGFDILIYCGVRKFSDQAKLYRQSRTKAQIDTKASQLKSKGFPELAEILYEVGPQSGKLGAHVTFSGPGESWHQYGFAADCSPIKSGKLMLDSTSHPEWQLLGVAAAKCGLYWAGNWKSFVEYPHVQYYSSGNPLTSVSRETVLKAIKDYK